MMDDPSCDPVKLARTYKQFKFVNRVVSSWGWLFKRHILPELKDTSETYTLLDVGCGLLDNGNYLQELAKINGYTLEIKGIDPNPIIAEMLENDPKTSNFEEVYLSEIVSRGEKYDFVISNHLMHHLDEKDLHELLADVAFVTKKVAVMNDLRRNIFSYFGFALATFPIKYHSFIHIDGLRSIRRSFRAKELEKIVPSGWKVRHVFPLRMAAIYRK
jgi:2-polyprenyl-3-methyl-5-hydroxy-6-metoxy-1,4-benzoquinol methylase